MMIFIALATAAFAAEPRHEVSLELGTHNSDSPAWGVIDSNSSNTIGIRGGYGINSRLTAIGSWHVGQIVTDHSSNSNDYYYEEPVHGSSGLNGGVYSSLLVNHLSAGAKISNQIQPWLVPYATGQAEGDPHDALFWRSGGLQVVMADGWKLQVDHRQPKRWLFHLDEDPTEQHNRIAEELERARTLEARLDAFNKEMGPRHFPALVEGPIPIDRTSADPYVPGEEFAYWPN